MQPYLTTVITVIVTTICTYLASRPRTKLENKKIEAEAAKVEISNVSDIIKIYEAAMDRLQKEVHALRDEVRELRQRLGLA